MRLLKARYAVLVGTPPDVYSVAFRRSDAFELVRQWYAPARSDVEPGRACVVDIRTGDVVWECAGYAHFTDELIPVARGESGRTARPLGR